MNYAIPLILAVSLATPALAALPPEHQRHAELQAVLDAAMGAFEGQPIDAVTYVETDHYEVKAGACTLMVDIVDKAVEREAGWVGPRAFEAVAGDKTCN